jgi:hypothetical protein
VVNEIKGESFWRAPADRISEVIASPPNKALQPTSQLVTPFAYAKGAPSCLAAEL